MKRFLVITVGACAYVFVASAALAYLPFSEVPAFFGGWFTKGWQASLFWMKARHLAIFCLTGAPAAWILVRQDPETALADSIAIGLLAAIWGVFLRWSVLGGFDHLGWLEITDYLVALLAIVIWVPVFKAARRMPTKGVPR